MITTYPATALALIFPLHVLLLILEGAVLALLKRELSILTKVYCRSIADLWRFRHKLLVARAYNQSHYKAGLPGFFKPFTCLPQKFVLLTRFGLPK